jgi:hypothetical protein
MLGSLLSGKGVYARSLSFRVKETVTRAIASSAGGHTDVRERRLTF